MGTPPPHVRDCQPRKWLSGWTGMESGLQGGHVSRQRTGGAGGPEEEEETGGGARRERTGGGGTGVACGQERWRCHESHSLPRDPSPGVGTSLCLCLGAARERGVGRDSPHIPLQAAHPRRVQPPGTPPTSPPPHRPSLPHPPCQDLLACGASHTSQKGPGPGSPPKPEPRAVSGRGSERPQEVWTGQRRSPAE